MSDKPAYRDRTDHYVPRYLSLPAPWKVEIGARPEHRTLHPATWGKPDELNDDHGSWDWADVSPDFDGSHWSHLLNGWHRIQVDIGLTTYNTREVHDWKGYDEVRPGGHWKLFFNRIQVCDGYVGSDVLETLLTIRQRIKQLQSLPIDWSDPEAWLLNRLVYYREVPAVVYRTVLSQGCVILRGNFPPSPGYNERTDGALGAAETEAKVEVYSPKIWWWRKQ